MTSRLAIALVCDECGLKADRVFRRLADIDAWMRANGWRELSYRDWCPACLAAPEPDPTNGYT